MTSKARPRKIKLLLSAAVTLAALAALTGCDLQETSDLDNGQQLFTQKCGSCHTLTAAGTSSAVGPNLDLAFQEARKSGMDQDTFEGVIQGQIEHPRPADPQDTAVYMPANLVEGSEAEDVSAYVASVAGVPGIQAPEFIPDQFFATTCGGCHTLSTAGTTGSVGPNLDDVLPGQTAAQVSESITDPNAQIEGGFSSGVMPQTYGDQLTPAQLNQLVNYLLQSVNGGK
ncbi:MAG: c-type cytochrome [Solirubrobacterales bacterium]|nr:c-type cytochrome [Solirubrobacterales bacterium]